MDILGVLLARPKELDEAEVNLGRPDPREAKDLAYHVARCATRWELSYRASRFNGARTDRLAVIIIIGVTILISSDTGTVHKWLSAL